MAKQLPYKVTTATGDSFDFEFALHADTASPVRVAQLLAAVLETVDKDLHFAADTGNGDVLQALAMALAVRARMIHAPFDQTAQLASTLLDTARASAARATHHAAPSGRA